MSYDGQESSVEDGQPIKLFRFWNDQEVFLYTNGPIEVVYNLETYVPAVIGHSDLTKEDLSENKDLQINVEASNAVAQRYINTVPAKTDEFEMFKQHSTDGGTPETVQLFQGNVTNISLKGSSASIHVRSFGSILERLIPQQTTRNPCNHFLYDENCAVSKGSFSMTVEVTAISSDGLTVTVDGSTNTIPDTGFQLSDQYVADPNFFLSGILARQTNEFRMVRAITDESNDIAIITVLFPFQTLSVGATMVLSAGCDLSFDTCGSKFDNKIRYGGFPHVPNKNVFSYGVKGE